MVLFKIFETFFQSPSNTWYVATKPVLYNTATGSVLLFCYKSNHSFLRASYTRRISPTLHACAKQPLEDTGFSPS